MDAIDDIMKDFYYIICNISKWIFAVKMASNVIKRSEASDIKGIVQDLISGGVAYAALYSIVSILDQIKAKF